LVSNNRMHGTDTCIPLRPRIIRQRLSTNLPPLSHEPTAPLTLGSSDLTTTQHNPLTLPSLHLPTRTRIITASYAPGTRGRPRDEDVLRSGRDGRCCVWTRGDRDGESERCCFPWHRRTSPVRRSGVPWGVLHVVVLYHARAYIEDTNRIQYQHNHHSKSAKPWDPGRRSARTLDAEAA
jgi:hypothetical protein